jgi:chromosome segregation ATPase
MLAEQLAALVAEQRDLKGRSKELQKTLRAMRRRCQRLKRKANQLSTDDLHTILEARLATAATGSPIPTTATDQSSSAAECAANGSSA